MSTEYLRLAGFTKFPDDIEHLVPCASIEQWLNDCHIPEAVIYYGLNTNEKFMHLFNEIWQQVLHSLELQCTIYIIAKYLFDDSIAPAWDKFERNTIDMLPAIIILTGWQQHVRNMFTKDFDECQIEFNKREIRDTITKAMRIYNKPGMLISEMIWGSILVRANLMEFGRMQYEPKTASETYACDTIASGDKIIGIHIPRGAPLLPGAVTQSITNARRHFGDLPFVCNSWLLGTELGNLLPTNSNIAKFREHFKIIRNLDSKSVYHFLFNTPDDNPDIAKLPTDTSLRKSVRDAMQSGIHFHDAVGLLKN